MRTSLLTVLLSLTAVLHPRAGQELPGITVEKLRANLFLLKGGNANTVVFVMSSGVAVIDTKGPRAGWGTAIAETVKDLTNKPMTLIINSHSHGDHVGGNVDFTGPIRIVAHEKAAANMRRMDLMFPKPSGGGLPTQTFKDRLTIGSGADRIDLYYFGRAHTDSDIFIVFPPLRMMYAGDAFQGKLVPALDRANGGNGVEYPETLAKAISSIRDIDAVITGHDGVMKPSDLAEYAKFMRDLLNAVREGKRQGKTAAQIADAWKLPAPYSGYEAPRARVRSTIEWTYGQLP